jgi:hypothetical protein
MPSGFPHRAAFSLFCVRAIIESNSENALRAALACFSRSESGDVSNADALTIYVTLKVYDVHEHREINSKFTSANAVCVSFDGVSVRADPESGHGVCELVEGDEVGVSFREAFNTVVVFLVAQAGRIPLHASAFMLGNRAVVLAGRSGSGKSTLVLAAARAGLRVLSEDTVFVQLSPKLRLWSWMEAIHVFERDAPGSQEGSMRFRSGRWKRGIPMNDRQDFADDALLCVLEHGCRVAISSITALEAIDALTAAPEPGYEFYGARSVDAATALTRNGAWRLTLSKEPRDAVALICRTFADNREKF